MNQFPFIFLNHGKITAESFLGNGINEVSFILFRRAVSVTERELIMKECPPDLKKGCFWSDKFLFFNPVSNETAEELFKLNHYLDWEFKEKSIDESFMEVILSGIPERAGSIEKWFLKVDEISKIAVCSSPFIPEYKDEWGQWSNENVYDCGIPLIDGILESNSSIARSDTPESRYFFRIHEFILKYLTIKL